MSFVLNRNRRASVAYAVAIGSVLAVVALRSALDPLLGDVAPLILFLIPVGLSAWFGGLGPGLLADALGLVCGVVLFSGPRAAPAHPGALFFWLARGLPFGLVGAMMSAFAAGMEEARERAEGRARAARAAGAALRRTEELQQRIFDSVRDFSIFTFDPAGIITSWNAGAERVFGHPEATALGMLVDELYTPEDRAAGVPGQERHLAARTGRSSDDRWHLRGSAGDRFFASGVVTPLRDEGGAVTGFAKVARDVTEQQRSRQALADALRRSDAALMAGEMGTFEWDVVADRLLGDENFARLFGVAPGAGGAAPLADYVSRIHPDDRDHVEALIRRSLETGEDYAAEYRVAAADRERWLLARGRMLRGEGGRVVRFPGVAVDITDRKRAEAANRFLAELSEAARRPDDPDAVMAVLVDRLGAYLRVARSVYAEVDADQDGIELRYDWVAPASGARSLVGRYRLSDFGTGMYADLRAGRTAVVVDARADARTADAAAAMSAAGVGAVVNVPILRDGRLEAVLAVHEPRPRAWTAGEVALVEAVAGRGWAEVQRSRGTQALRASEVSLRAALATAEQASRMKDDFLATVSHELRTPLNAILGWASLLSQDASDPEFTAEGLEVIARNGAAQAKLIEDILDVSRITSGKVRLNAEQLDVRLPVEAAIATVAHGARAKDITVRRDLGVRPAEVVGDADRLQQVFWNLIANAIKFTPRGGTVHVAVTTTDSRLLVTVADSGQGIAADFLPHVFDRFRQADMTTARREGGLGLGLAIVRHLVELHGGTVSVASEGAGRGSTFRVELPFATVERERPGGAGSPIAMARDAAEAECGRELLGARVLVLDDEPDARRVVQAVLARCGAEVTLIGNVADAIGILVADHRFDAVVSDVGMPGEDGYAFIRRMRELERQRPGGRRLPVAALTAYTRPADRDAVVAAGFDHHLAKPVQPAEILRIVTDMIRESKA